MQTVTITTKRQATRRGEENMADCEATNEDFKHLDDGLPADIARLKAAGQLGRAVALIEAELDAGTRPELAACLRAERARMLRTPLDFA